MKKIISYLAFTALMILAVTGCSKTEKDVVKV